MEPSLSIGSIVLYQRHGSPNGQHKAEPSPAIVTEVTGEQEATLFVMNPNGLYFNRNTKYDPAAGPGTWRWPHQK
jgi:filamentous hemagglutinin family protein